MPCRNSGFQTQPLKASLYIHRIGSVRVLHSSDKASSLCTHTRMHTHTPQHPGLILYSTASISRQRPKLAALGRSLLLLLWAHNGLFTEGSSLPIVYPWPDMVRVQQKRTGEQPSASLLQRKQPQEPMASSPLP